MDRDLQTILGKRIGLMMQQAGCMRYNVLLFPNIITIRADDAHRALMDAGNAIETMFKELGIAGAQVSVKPNLGTIRIAFAAERSLDRVIQRAIDQGKL